MILENIKKIIQEPLALLRYFLAVVFLSAGMVRIFLPIAAEQELLALQLPTYFSIYLSLFEIIVGLMLIFNQGTKYVYICLTVFLIATLSWALIIQGPELIKAIEELFVFDLNPTDWFLHFVFLLLVLRLLTSQQQNK